MDSAVHHTAKYINRDVPYLTASPSPPALERRFFEIDLDGYCTVPVDWRRQKPKPRSLRCAPARATSNHIGRVGHCGWPAPSAGHKSTNAKTVPTKIPQLPRVRVWVKTRFS